MTEVRLWQVLCSGAAGGMLSLVHAFAVGREVTLPWYWAALAFPALGAAAALIGVYVLTVSDTKAALRCIAFALLCGLVWKPVIEAGSALVTQTAAQQKAREVAVHTTELQAMAADLAESPGPDLPSLLTKVEQTTNKIVRLLPAVPDPEMRADAEDTVRNVVAVVERVAPQRPRESVDVLTRLAVTGLATRQPQFATLATTVLHDVGIGATSPEVSIAAYGGLNEVAAAAESRPDSALAAEARYLGADMVLVAAARAEADGRADSVARLPTGEAMRNLETAQKYFEARGDQARADRSKMRALEFRRLSKPPGGPQ
jgi:hypothetical protein